ncbi:methionine ABC transporter ATP-binding protein [Aeromicrobium endophyticum]|uniref:ATP-binding cassette domain-containing protein n=1 Tax=Aeromicrobium endophyticum TaxID=2292704 RepID=A0A371PE85_9ACTN|nr:ATP-binding cassette domain-containing protein [Aeromicrobium endophyticum]REK73828.1 ATP-binding cassette domain-containing protein [Aeromicrobium endophyticum]
MTLIELRGVSKTFPPTRKGGEPVHAVRDVDLSVEAGEIVGIVGYSGAGKSTLVRLVNALEPATSGQLFVDGTDLTTLGERQLQKVRLDIGMIFQQFNLLQSRTVWGNVAYPLEVAGVPKAEHQRRISDLLNFVGLADKAHAWPEELSGGQKQRVGIARALATSPKILLADEATSALDPETTVEVLRLLAKVNTELGITIVVITHEMDVVKTIADRVVVMEQGRIVEQGPVFEIFSAPREQATRRFVATLVDAVPDAVEIEGLRRTHGGRLLTLSFRDESVSQSAVFAEIIGRGVEFELVFGGIEDVRGRSFGHLTLELRGDAAAVDEAVRAVGALVETTEVA